jgi:hypothetical protein
MKSAAAAVTVTADQRQSDGVRFYEEGRYEEALLVLSAALRQSEVAPWHLWNAWSAVRAYRDLAECSDAKHVLCHWRKWLFVAEGYQGIDAGCAASWDVACYQGDEEEQ